jgi:arsenite-transporting ATPase
VRGKLPESVVRSIEEQLSGACTTEIAAFDEFTAPMMQLQDPKQTKVLIVTLPEPTPVQEAANLQADLRRAGIEPWGWLINHSLQQAAVSSPLLQLRAERQLPHIEAVEQQHASRYAVVPLLADALRRLCQHH